MKRRSESSVEVEGALVEEEKDTSEVEHVGEVGDSIVHWLEAGDGVESGEEEGEVLKPCPPNGGEKPWRRVGCKSSSSEVIEDKLN